MRLLFNQIGCTQSLLPLQDTPDVEVRLLIKSLLVCVAFEYTSESHSGDGSVRFLTGEEISTLKRATVKSDSLEPFFFHGLSFKILFSMIRTLARDSQNAARLMQADFPSVLAELADVIESDKQKEEIAGLIWTLMQGEIQEGVGESAEVGEDTPVSTQHEVAGT